MNVTARLAVIAWLLSLGFGCSQANDLRQDSEHAKMVERVQLKETWLQSAGFKSLPADTPSKQHIIQSLPKWMLVSTKKKGKTHYWYIDPDVCHCIFKGDKATYERYEQIKQQAKNSNQSDLAMETGVETEEMPEIDTNLNAFDPDYAGE